MDIKDVKPGQIVYVVLSSYRMSRYIVVSVNNEYIHVKSDADDGREFEFFKAFKNQERAYFVAQGYSSDGGPLLFLTKDAAQDYIEKEELRLWVFESTSFDKLGEYTYSQLNAVKEILRKEMEDIIMEWTNVKDDMPDPFENVIVTVRSKDDPDFADVVVGAFYNDKRNLWEFDTNDGIEPIDDSVVVTHWMPYPEPFCD